MHFPCAAAAFSVCLSLTHSKQASDPLIVAPNPADQALESRKAASLPLLSPAIRQRRTELSHTNSPTVLQSAGVYSTQVETII